MNSLMKFALLSFTGFSLAACGGGGGGGSATNTATGEVVSCSVESITSVNCEGQSISISDIAGMTDNGDGTYTIQYMGGTWIVRPSNYDATVAADIITAHKNGVNGSGVTITTVDGFTGQSAAHGAHVKSIIDMISPGSTSQYIDVDNQYGEGLDLTRALNNPANLQNADIINASLGGYTSDGRIYFVNDNGTPSDPSDDYNMYMTDILQGFGVDASFVVAAGNDAYTCSTPATCNYVAYELVFGDGGHYSEQTIVVGAVNPEGTNLDSYSNLAGLLKHRYIAAPVVSSSDGGRGTSYAAPVVAGVIGLIMDNQNSTNAQTATNRVLRTADGGGVCQGNVESISGIYCADDRVGRGRLNVGRALSPVGGLQ